MLQVELGVKGPKRQGGGGARPAVAHPPLDARTTGQATSGLGSSSISHAAVIQAGSSAETPSRSNSLEKLADSSSSMENHGEAWRSTEKHEASSGMESRSGSQRLVSKGSEKQRELVYHMMVASEAEAVPSPETRRQVHHITFPAPSPPGSPVGWQLASPPGGPHRLGGSFSRSTHPSHPGLIPSTEGTASQSQAQQAVSHWHQHSPLSHQDSWASSSKVADRGNLGGSQGQQHPRLSHQESSVSPWQPQQAVSQLPMGASQWLQHAVASPQRSAVAVASKASGGQWHEAAVPSPPRPRSRSRCVVLQRKGEAVDWTDDPDSTGRRELVGEKEAEGGQGAAAARRLLDSVVEFLDRIPVQNQERDSAGDKARVDQTARCHALKQTDDRPKREEAAGGGPKKRAERMARAADGGGAAGPTGGWSAVAPTGRAAAAPLALFRVAHHGFLRLPPALSSRSLSLTHTHT